MRLSKFPSISFSRFRSLGVQSDHYWPSLQPLSLSWLSQDTLALLSSMVPVMDSVREGPALEESLIILKVFCNLNDSVIALSSSASDLHLCTAS